MNRTLPFLLFAAGALFAILGVVAFRSLSESAVVSSTVHPPASPSMASASSAAPSTTATEAPPASSAASAAPLPTSPAPTGTSPEKRPEIALALPIAKVDVVAELRKLGYEFEPHSLPTPTPGADGFRIKNTTAGLTLIERDGRLVLIIVAFPQTTDFSAGERTIEFLEAVGTITTGLTRDQARLATARALLDIGPDTTDRRRFIGYTQDRVLVRFLRTAAGDTIITFMPASVLGL